MNRASASFFRIEYGRQNLTIRTIFRLAEALEMPVVELLTDLTGTPPTQAEPPEPP